MLLSQIEQSFNIGDKFGINIRNGKMFFTVNGDTHVFGSKIYPIGKRGHIFMENVTEKVDYGEVAKTIERGNWKFKSGYCYTNAEILQAAFKSQGIDAKYFTGWVFPSPSYPVHHAWVVVDDNVYDIGIHNKSQTKLIDMALRGIDPYSPKAIKELKAIESQIFPLQENFIWGKVPEHMVYVGAESDPRSARMQYNKAYDSTDNHPSYSRKDGKHFKSKLQQLMEDA